MSTPTVENYLKQIYRAQLDGQEGLVAMGQLAGAVGVTAGTATTMVKSLADDGLVHYEPRGGVRLTKAGEKLALQVVRRHRLLELFLVQVLGMDWSEVHAEAEQLEHALSDKVLGRLDILLGHPQIDPHGDPIPPATGAFREVRGISLLSCEIGVPYRLARVLDETPEFLRFLTQRELALGSNLMVVERQPAADTLTVALPGGRQLTLGLAAAGKLLVEAHVDKV
jgi:DtxR family transcriptional regulator, Mn-dependent transcriptional regulator